MVNVKIGAAHQDGNPDAPLSTPLLYESNSMNDINSTRKCKKCGTSNRTATGRCRACSKANQKAWNEKNPGKAKALNREHYKKHPKTKEQQAASYAANKEKRRAYAAAYRAAHPGKQAEYLSEYRKKNKEAANAASSAWRAANPLKRKVHHQNRRSAIRGNGGKLSCDIVPKLLSLQRGKCACCGINLGGKYHLDHITPLALGGKNEDANVQLLSPLCNLQKKAKDPIDFMQSKGFLL